MSTRWCVFQTHISLFTDGKKPPTLVAKPSPPPFSQYNGLFPFPTGTAWPTLSFFVSWSRQLLIFISCCFPPHKRRLWFIREQLPATFQIHGHGSPSPSSRCLGSPLIRYALQLRAICLLLEAPDETLIDSFTSNLRHNTEAHGAGEQYYKGQRWKLSVGEKCEMGAFQRTKRVASWSPLPSRVALGLCPRHFCVKWRHLNVTLCRHVVLLIQ